jgi:hypothetical protein
VVRERLPGPHPGQHLHRLIDDAGPYLDVRFLAESGVSEVLRVTGADAQSQPPTRQVVEGHGFACQLPGAAAGQRGHHGAQPDAGRGGRHCGQRYPGIVGGQVLAVLVDDVVLHEHRVPPGLLRCGGEAGQDPRMSRFAPDGEVQAIPHRRAPIPV